MTENISYEVYCSTRRFGSLDGLRALSIIAVLWHHSNGPEAFEILKRGQMGVYLFFAVSGFLITTLLLRERSEQGYISIKNFFIRRSLRIFPLYYAVILLYVVAVMALEGDSAAGKEFFSNLPYFLTYTTNWFVDYREGVRTIFYFSWSLATEEQFYLVFPWLLALTGVRFTSVALVFVFVGVYLTHSNGLYGAIPGGSFLEAVIWNIAPCITLGALAAIALHSRRGFDIAKPIFGHKLGFPVVLCIVLLLMCIPRGGVLQEYLVYSSLVALVISAVIREDHGLSSAMRKPWVVRIGVISYGIYLLHMLCFNATDLLWRLTDLPQWVGRMTLGVMLTVVAAEISYRTFESWFLRKKEQFGRESAPTAAP